MARLLLSLTGSVAAGNAGRTRAPATRPRRRARPRRPRRALRRRSASLPGELLPDFDYLTALATPGLRERLLREADISTLHTEMFAWPLPIASAGALSGR
jgi:hypothetical protein